MEVSKYVYTYEELYFVKFYNLQLKNYKERLEKIINEYYNNNIKYIYHGIRDYDRNIQYIKYFESEDYINDLKYIYGNIFTEDFIFNNLKNKHFIWDILFKKEEFSNFINEKVLIKLIKRNYIFNFLLNAFIEKNILNISFIIKHISLFNLELLCHISDSMNLYDLFFNYKDKLLKLKKDEYSFDMLVYHNISRSEKLKWSDILCNYEWKWDWYYIIYINKKNIIIPPIILNYLNKKYTRHTFYKIKSKNYKIVMTNIIKKWKNGELYSFNEYLMNVF